MSQQNSGSRTNTRLSDYSQSGGGGGGGSSSNAASRLLRSSNQQTSIDPWAKRNIVAQNVLMKHRAELEQIAAATRHSNRSSNSSNPSGGAGPPPPIQQLAGTPTPTGKFLIPEGSKYYKK